MAEYEAFRATPMAQLESCPTCGRTFVPESLAKHARICSKSTQKRRKVFDSGRMRAQGTDIPVNKTKRTQPLGTQPKMTPSKASNWRQKHEDFIATIRAAKQSDVAIKTGKPLPPPPPPTINPDYVQCPHCDRRFNETAAERHIPFCAEQKQRLGNKKTADARSRMNARTQYKAPLPGKKKPAANSATANSRTGPPANSAPGRGVSSGYGSAGTRKNTGGGSLTNGSPASGRSSGSSRTTLSGGRGRRQFGHDVDSDDSGDRSPLGHGQGASLRTGRVNASVRQANSKSGLIGGINSRTPTPPNVGRGRPPSGQTTGTRRNRGSAGLQQNHAAMSGNGRYNQSYYDDYETGDYELPERFRQAVRLGSTDTIAGNTASKFCHECGSRYPIPNAKFCCECGSRRIWIEQ